MHRDDFPILKLQISGKPLVYLDNGATTQKPRQVIEAIDHYYRAENANIHRGVYHLSQLATERYEQARHNVRQFINAGSDKEIIFTRGSTEGINLVAHSFCMAFLKPGDEIVVSTIEHHANIVPWQLEAEQRGGKVRAIPVNDRGELDLDALESMLRSGKVKMVAVNHVSNSLGTINDVQRIVKAAHSVGAKVLVDGAQWVPHYPTDVQALDADFYVFSAHKLYGPTGIGVLYGKKELLEAMPPYQSGGDMIASVSFEGTTFADLPNKFEAGTPDIAGAVGLGAAIDYLSAIGMDAIAKHEDELGAYLNEQVGKIDGIRVIGTAGRKAGICSFVIENPPISAHDAGVMLDMEGIAVRTGHHCCQPAMERMKVSATIRASIGLYNTKEDVDALVGVVKKIVAAAASMKRSGPLAASRINAVAGGDSSIREAASGGEVRYPGAAAASVAAAAEELAEMFEFLGEDPNGKARFVMEDLAPTLPDHFELLKKATPRLEGCMSEVYLVGRRSPKDASVVEFVADANSQIVRGEIVMLQKLFSGQKADEVLSFDLEQFFHRIGLEKFLTNQRRTGLASMVKKVRGIAERG